MADITITGASSRTSRAPRSLVSVSTTVVYQFYINTSTSFCYRKSTDGGATWGSAVEVKVSDDCMAFDVWFDQWTPGDSGTKIHLWYFGTTADDVFYRNLNTSGDSLSTEKTVFNGASSATSRGVIISGAKMRGGNLLCVFQIDNGAEHGTYRSTDAGDTWGSRTDLYEASSLDDVMVFPGNEADNQDAWILYQDGSANAFTLKVHDDSANTNTESSTIMSLTEDTTDGVGQFAFSGSIRHSDGHLIAVAFSERDTGAQDFRVFDINGTGSITEKTAITTDIDDMYYPSVFIDQTTDDLYVAYIGKRDGSSTLNVNAAICYVKSTDDGATWSSGDTAYSVNDDDTRQTWTPLSGDLFIVSWRDISTSDILTNADNAVEFAGGGQTVDVPVGLLDFLSVAPSVSKSASLPSGLMRFVSGALVEAQQALVPIGLLDLLGVTPASLKAASVSPAIICFKQQGLQTSHSVPVDPAIVEFQGQSLSFDVFADVLPVSVGLLSVEPSALHSAPVPVGLVGFLGLEPSTPRQAAALPGVLGFIALGPSYGPYYGIVATAVAGGMGDWTNASDAVISDNTPASFSAIVNPDPIDITDFGSVSFSGAVHAVKMEARVRTDIGCSTGWHSAQLIKGGVPVGAAVFHFDNQAASGDWTWVSAGTHEIAEDFGVTLDASEIDANFGVRIRFNAITSGLSGDIYVDDVRLTFYKESSLLSDKSVTLSSDTVGLLGAAPASSKQVSVSVVLVGFLGLPPDTVKQGLIPFASIELLGVGPYLLKQASVSFGVLSLSSLIFDFAKNVFVEMGVVGFLSTTLEINKEAALNPGAVVFGVTEVTTVGGGSGIIYINVTGPLGVSGISIMGVSQVSVGGVVPVGIMGVSQISVLAASPVGISGVE